MSNGTLHWDKVFPSRHLIRSLRLKFLPYYTHHDDVELDVDSWQDATRENLFWKAHLPEDHFQSYESC